MAKFRDLPDWEQVKKDLGEKCGLDKATVEKVGDIESDFNDRVEMMMALEEAFPMLRNRGA